MTKLGIECENLEDPKSRWGVGQITLNLLEEYLKNPEWQREYRVYLYFKKHIPDDEILKNTIFIKRVLGFPSFNIFYHILMPLRAMMDGLDWMFFPAYMLPPLYLRKSIVMLTNDVYYEYKYGNLPFRYKLAYRLFTNWAAIRANKILAISEDSKKEIARLYKIKPERIFVAHLGVRLPFFAQGFEGRQTKGNYLLFVGQMFPRRHAKETILAFKKIALEFPDLKLIMVGKDKYPVALINSLIKDVNQGLGGERIIHYDYLEKREDIDNLYVGAKVLIYVSDREAFGLPPMEALAFGVPPVIADNELGHELFGEYAFYSPKENNPSEALAKEGSLIDNIAHAIYQALTDKQKISKIKSEGPEFVKKYNWQSFVDKFFDELGK